MVNATQLSSYMYCPRKLFIGNVLLVEEPPKESLVKGLVWHQTYETLNKREEKIVKSIRSANYQDIFDMYRREYAKFLRNSLIRNKTELKKFNIQLLDLFKDYWTHFENEAKKHALHVSEFIKKYNVFGDDLWEKLTPKIVSEQYMKSEKYGISGIIDVTEIHGEVHVPVELKTGSVPKTGMWDGHRIQLATYMMLLEDSGKKVVEGVIKYKDAEDNRVLQFNSFLRDEVLDLVHEVNKIISNFDIPDRVTNKNKCTKCSFRDICYNDVRMHELVDEAKKRKGSESVAV
jgi:CRISPR-associated protein Cas4